VLTALIDRVQGRWEQSTTGLEKAAAFDPRNPEVLGHLADNYGRLRRYRDCEEIFNRLIALEPESPSFLLSKINWRFFENADVKSARAACEALPSSTKADPWVANLRFYYAVCARDFAAAEKILNEIPNEEIDFLGALVPRQIVTLQLRFVQGILPTMNEFSAARDRLYRKVEADPSNPWLVAVLALTDAALGRKDEGIKEGQRALEMRSISEDAFDGPFVAMNVAIVYATADQLDAAFEQLNTLVQLPADPLSYGDLKTCPCWDPLRKDARFDKLLAELAPREPTEKSVAVLPFESLSESKSDAYFADGVQDEILNNLAKIVQLKVICRTSVMQYRADAKRDLRQIATALGVANVLEGTVRRDGNHVRVSTELVDARNYNTIWADSYDRDLSDIFAIQSEIAQKVASRLSAQLSPQEEKGIEEKPTDNLEAYDLYLQAKQLLQANYYVMPSSEKEIYSKIISLLEEAIQKDSKFALAYCLMAEAHDMLYSDRIDYTPERRALGDAAVNEALRLQPDLPEAHLALATHLYFYREFERARVQIAIAAQSLANSSALLELAALIDRAHGRWERSIAGLERAAILDPRNPEILVTLAYTYGGLRRYQDAKRTLDRVIQLKPDQQDLLVTEAWWAFFEKADANAARATCERFPSSIKDDPFVLVSRVYFAMCARDFDAVEAIISKAPTEELVFADRGSVPRQFYTLWLEFIQGKHPTMDQFGATRDQLYRKVEADPANPDQMTALAFADAFLGRKEESIQEGWRAMEMRPISEDAFEGPTIARNIAMVYATVNESDSAFKLLTILVTTPGSWALNYGDLKTNPGWDPLRKDPRFDKLLAEVAPRD
jgi:TolB-like protein/Flp pilus assembly protein TadD